MATDDCPDLLGTEEIAELLGVERRTVNAWRTRGRLLDPCAVISQVPVWTRPSVVAWAAATNRLPDSTPVMFGEQAVGWVWPVGNEWEAVHSDDGVVGRARRKIAAVRLLLDYVFV